MIKARTMPRQKLMQGRVVRGHRLQCCALIPNHTFSLGLGNVLQRALDSMFLSRPLMLLLRLHRLPCRFRSETDLYHDKVTHGDQSN